MKRILMIALSTLGVGGAIYTVIRNAKKKEETSEGPESSQIKQDKKGMRILLQ